LGKTPSIAHVIEGTANLLPNAYMPFAILERTDDLTRSKVLESVNLIDVANGADVQLKSEDNLIVFSTSDVAFITSGVVRDIVLGQSNSLPECRSLSSLERLVQQVQTDRFSGIVKGVFLVEKGGQASAADLNSLRTSGSSNVGQEAKTVKGESKSEIMQLQRQARASGEGEAQEDESSLCPQVFEDYPDVLPFALEHVVAVSGAVRNPGALPVSGKISLQNLITLSGGYARDADDLNVEVINVNYDIASQTGQTERSTIQGSVVDFKDVEIVPGSSVRVQSISDDQETGAVLLTGEFRRPGSYTIQRGETLAQLIDRAGGVTSQAYPYGAVFTRRSVKEAQEEGFKRASRELNAALAVAALRKNVDASAVAAAQQLSGRFETAEALGRMVIEADPRVLKLRNDLNVVLEPGDTLFMPKRPGHVLMIGDVLNPGALQFIRGKDVADYLGEAGGLQSSADDDRIFLVYPNGVAKPVRVSAWRSSSALVPPGSTIVVPKDTDPLAALDLTRDITGIVSQLAISAASLAVIFDR
jgi:protein involved in polysaccharide export with SLBB domain